MSERAGGAEDERPRTPRLRKTPSGRCSPSCGDREASLRHCLGNQELQALGGLGGMR